MVNLPTDPGRRPPPSPTGMTISTPHQGVIDRAYQALADVWDPELGFDVVSLGLIYDIRLEDAGLVIDMTLTTPGCPVSEQLPREAAEAIRRALPEYPVRMNIVWDPPWTPERMSKEVVGALGFR